VSATDPDLADAARPGERGGSADRVERADLGLAWWKELLFVAGFYGIYTFIRDEFGSASVGAVHALHNATRVIHLEQWLGIFHEQAVQHWFLQWPSIIRFFNLYYGSLHFLVPIGVLLALFWKWPEDYRFWRNTLAATTAVALIGFSLFPLMPPRLLCDCAYGAGPGVHYGFVDTLARFGGSWSFDSGAMKDVSNQYAAMPSLHVAWSLWCAAVLVPRLRHAWAKALAALYPVVTLTAVVVTANHYFLDAVGGALTLALGALIARALPRRKASRAPDRVSGRTA
jgi:hypothetical protein